MNTNGDTLGTVESPVRSTLLSEDSKFTEVNEIVEPQQEGVLPEMCDELGYAGGSLRALQHSDCLRYAQEVAEASDTEPLSPANTRFFKYRNETSTFIGRVDDASSSSRLHRLIGEPRRDLSIVKGGDPFNNEQSREHHRKVLRLLKEAMSEENLCAAVTAIEQAGIGWMEGIEEDLTEARETLRKMQCQRAKLREALHFGGIQEIRMAITGAKELPSPGPHEPTISDLVQMNEVKLEQLMAERREMARQYVSDAEQLARAMPAIPAWFLRKDAETQLPFKTTPEVERFDTAILEEPQDINANQVRMAADVLMRNGKTKRAILQCAHWLEKNNAPLRKRSTVVRHAAHLRSEAIRRLRAAVEGYLWGSTQSDRAIAHAIEDARDIGSNTKGQR